MGTKGLQGEIALALQDYPAAELAFCESLRASEGLYAYTDRATALLGLALTALDGGRPMHAITLFALAESCIRLGGEHRPPRLLAQVDHAMTSVRAEVGDEAFDRAWQKGREMTLDEAVELALNEP